MNVKTELRSLQPYAGIRARMPQRALPQHVPDLFRELFSILAEHEIKPEGAPLIRYLLVDYNTSEVEVDVGVPVSTTSSIPIGERARIDLLPGGSFATVLHRGDYAGLSDTTAGLLDAARAEGLAFQMVEQENVTRWSGRIEHYLVGPPDEPNPANWETHIAILTSN